MLDVQDSRRGEGRAGIAADRDMLGPDAEDGAVAERPARRLERQGEPASGEWDRRPAAARTLCAGGEGGHPRAADEAGDETVGRAIREIERGPELPDPSRAQH